MSENKAPASKRAVRAVSSSSSTAKRPCPSDDAVKKACETLVRWSAHPNMDVTAAVKMDDLIHLTNDSFAKVETRMAAEYGPKPLDWAACLPLLAWEWIVRYCQCCVKLMLMCKTLCALAMYHSNKLMLLDTTHMARIANTCFPRTLPRWHNIQSITLKIPTGISVEIARVLSLQFPGMFGGRLPTFIIRGKGKDKYIGCRTPADAYKEKLHEHLICLSGLDVVFINGLLHCDLFQGAPRTLKCINWLCNPYETSICSCHKTALLWSHSQRLCARDSLPMDKLHIEYNRYKRLDDDMKFFQNFAPKSIKSLILLTCIAPDPGDEDRITCTHFRVLSKIAYKFIFSFEAAILQDIEQEKESFMKNECKLCPVLDMNRSLSFDQLDLLQEILTASVHVHMIILQTKEQCDNRIGLWKTVFDRINKLTEVFGGHFVVKYSLIPVKNHTFKDP